MDTLTLRNRGKRRSRQTCQKGKRADSGRGQHLICRAETAAEDCIPQQMERKDAYREGYRRSCKHDTGTAGRYVQTQDWTLRPAVPPLQNWTFTHRPVPMWHWL